MFPFFPFGPVPPFPFLFPFNAPFTSMMAGMAGGRPSDHEDGAAAAGSAMPFGGGSMSPMSLMGMAMMPVMAPFAMGSRLAQAVDDAGRMAAQITESLDRDEGPVHVMVGDPDGPLGLAIGLTFITRGQRPALHDANGTVSPASDGGMIDVTPPRGS